MTDLNIDKLGADFDEELNIREVYPKDNSSEYNLPTISSKPKICIYFSRNGYCKFGEECKYYHKIKIREKSSRTFFNSHLVSQSYGEGGSQHTPNQNFSPNSYHAAKKYSYPSERSYRKKSTPLCYFYKKGKCTKGDDCKYYHQNKNIVIEKSFSKEQDKRIITEDKISNLQTVNEDKKTEQSLAIVKEPEIQDLTTSKEIINQLRTTEINQLKKRFPHAEELLEDEKYSFVFQPTDPDWPFDLRVITVQACFPKKYPLEKCSISVIKDAENIPELLVRFINKAVFDWISQKYDENAASDKAELVFRPFLKWFDRNLEELFISGLRKVKQDRKAKDDGIEFVPPENLFPSVKEDTNFSEEEYVTDEKSELISALSQAQLQKSSSKASSPAKDQNSKQFQHIGNNVMKILLSELELVEGAAALTCTKISVTLQCCRCKSSFHMKSTPKKNNVSVCSKCSKNVGLTFEANTVHQFSNVVGSLYLLDCVAVDMNLVESHFLVDCLNCSKQVPVDGIHYGQKHKLWCTFCNAKMLITIGSVKFQTIRLSAISDIKGLPVKKSEKKIKDPVIKEGSPLPDYGACKHYKKSFRWLRFPCCGRLYPCDECHNEKETDHEMKYASRMVCGYCSKEQPYSKEKPCHLCSQNLTKKSGYHWEGGKGCRNKIQMSREDKQKYAGTCKTVSRKAQNAKN